MNWLYALIVLICLLPFAQAADESVEVTASSTPSEPSSQITSKLKKVRPRNNRIASSKYVTDVCEYTGRSQEDVECSYKIYQAVEAQLNIRYKKLLVDLDEITKEDPVRLADLKPKLISAQRAWMKFRENECRAIEVWYTNGKLQGHLYATCMREHAEKRIEELSSFTNYQT